MQTTVMSLSSRTTSGNKQTCGVDSTKPPISTGHLTPVVHVVRRSLRVRDFFKLHEAKSSRLLRPVVDGDLDILDFPERQERRRQRGDVNLLIKPADIQGAFPVRLLHTSCSDGKTCRSAIDGVGLSFNGGVFQEAPGRNDTS